EHLAVAWVDVDPRPVAEQTPAGPARAGVDSEHGNRASAVSPLRDQTAEQRGLAHAGGSGHPDDVPRGVVPEGRRGDLGEQLLRLRLGVRGAALDQVEGRGRGAQVALAKSCPEVAAACPGALGQAPTAVLMPCRSATSSMMSRIIPFRFQSLGVYTAAIPASRRASASASGMIPPTTTGTSSTPASCSASITDGISSRWEPERIDRPITCAPSWAAELAIWVGVRRMPS